MTEPVQTVSPTQQPSGNISLGSSLSFSEYNNSRYGFKVHYPSNWQLVSITNSSVLPSITNNTTEIIARFKSPFDPQERTEDVVTISVENLSATSSQRGIRNLSVYDYAAPLIQQLSPMSKAPNEPNQAILILNESLDIMSDTGGKYNKNFSAWRIDYLSSDYKSDVFVISDNNLFDINFSTSKERATQSVPMFDKLLDTIQFINEKNNTTSGDTFGNIHTINATANQSMPNLRTMPSSQILQQGVQPLSDLVQQDQDQNPQQQALRYHHLTLTLQILNCNNLISCYNNNNHNNNHHLARYNLNTNNYQGSYSNNYLRHCRSRRTLYCLHPLHSPNFLQFLRWELNRPTTTYHL